MYEVISIAEACMTRYVHLRNCETGAIEHCFDDSDVRDEDQKDFWFMKVGERYDCKIMLFGGPLEPDEEITEKCMICRQIGPMEKLGLYNIIPVESGGNIYYITEADAEEISNIEEFTYVATRKDLIQVDDVISPRYLWRYNG
ncbi:MAG TPA: hypothetical protein P5191_12515 [Ruminococcus sp.]|nr:hypothetical protein [Ruminococcus sp.]